MPDILVYVLHYEGAFNKNSLGAVSEGARLAGELAGEAHAVVVGGDDLSDELCGSLGAYGATKVFRGKGPEGLAQPVVDVMAKVIQDNGQGYALFGGGLLGFEIGAGLAARLNAGVTMEVTEVKVDDGKLVASRPILQDSKVSESRYKGDLGVIIGRLNAFEASEQDGASAAVEDVDVELSAWSTKATMVQRGEQRGADVNIEDADILVAGGRGLGKAEGFGQFEELSNVLGGAVAATRAVVDAGWYPYSTQIGQTGKTVAPKLYLAAGTAGLAPANRLLQLLSDDPELMERLGEVPVAVIEKAKTSGGHNLSGAVMRPAPLQELYPDMTREQWREKGFAFGEVDKEAVYLTPTAKRAIRIPPPPPFKNHGNEVISVSALNRFQQQQAEEGGAYILTETAATQLLVEDGRVQGVRTGDKGRGKDGEPLGNFEPGTDVTAQATVLAEGCWGHLTGAAIREFDLAANREPQVWALGVKEVWKVPKKLDRVIHTLGWPLRYGSKWHEFGGSWIYPMGDDRVSIGFVVGLDYTDATVSGHDLLQQFKTSKLVRRILEGGERGGSGGKAIPGGGY